MPIGKMVSLGSVFHQPVAVYYRAPGPIYGLSYFKGKRVAIGPEGSGTRALALSLLEANGITADTGTQLSNLSGEAAAQALVERRLDAVFLMGDSATPPCTKPTSTSPLGFINRFRFSSDPDELRTSTVIPLAASSAR